MAYLTANQLADYLLCEARYRGEALTHLKLQKLCYYAQAWWLALHGEPLIEEDFQAWVHGPVLTSQFGRFRDYRWQPIVHQVPRPEVPEGVRTHLDEVMDVFGVESAVALERMTHEEAPWLEARGELPPHEASRNVIRKETMQSFYASLN
ncbi:hypothetical protein RA2_03703 [Roseovarius sp. A-2]|uniref:Panacea domain-containing protein n=1 Tax=Roseovarius sp. A-2 TaxID=1570360 RepID=UPI0009B539D9|nr:type II toxin-antitoxin system antitoxin SocA domain-containing protein [Roseovarius sp. A-2]GAW36630.1 hypothetical protein RA2_03703 [Roseovarius sp. A-2]